MKTLLMNCLIATLLTGTALAAPVAVKTPPSAAKPAAPAASTTLDVFADVVHESFRLGPVVGGFQVALCECLDSREVCERPCELWNHNGTCAKWGLPVCIEKCVKWSCQEQH